MYLARHHFRVGLKHTVVHNDHQNVYFTLFCQEGMVKMIVAGEALVANYESQGPHLEPLLRVAFDPARQGDTRPDLT
jgi:hypothetical protein